MDSKSFQKFMDNFDLTTFGKFKDSRMLDLIGKLSEVLHKVRHYLELLPNSGHLLLDLGAGPGGPGLLTHPVRIHVQRVRGEHRLSITEDRGHVGSKFSHVGTAELQTELS